MLQETIEGKWVKAFTDVFRLCAVKPPSTRRSISDIEQFFADLESHLT